MLTNVEEERQNIENDGSAKELENGDQQKSEMVTRVRCVTIDFEGIIREIEASN